MSQELATLLIAMVCIPLATSIAYWTYSNLSIRWTESSLMPSHSKTEPWRKLGEKLTIDHFKEF